MRGRYYGYLGGSDCVDMVTWEVVTVVAMVTWVVVTVLIWLPGR